MTDEEHKWIETNNSVCALLRQAHDVLAMSSFPPRRTWVGLTDEEIDYIYTGIRAVHHDVDSDVLCRAIEAKLKELNT
jgi:hypothetical protein